MDTTKTNELAEIFDAPRVVEMAKIADFEEGAKRALGAAKALEHLLKYSGVLWELGVVGFKFLQTVDETRGALAALSSACSGAAAGLREKLDGEGPLAKYETGDPPF